MDLHRYLDDDQEQTKPPLAKKFMDKMVEILYQHVSDGGGLRLGPVLEDQNARGVFTGDPLITEESKSNIFTSWSNGATKEKPKLVSLAVELKGSGETAGNGGPKKSIV